MLQQRWSTYQWALQTFKKHKMGHASEKVDNHCTKQIALHVRLLPYKRDLFFQET